MECYETIPTSRCGLSSYFNSKSKTTMMLIGSKEFPIVVDDDDVKVVHKRATKKCVKKSTGPLDWGEGKPGSSIKVVVKKFRCVQCQDKGEFRGEACDECVCGGCGSSKAVGRICC